MSLSIFVDYHHGGLYNSLKMLTTRLGGVIYRPIGEDWFQEGYWKIAEPYGNHPDTIKQFLSTEPHEQVQSYCNTDATPLPIQGAYLIQDEAHNSVDRAMTLDLFKQVNFDVIIVSYPWHLESWLQLQEKYQPQAKVVLQVGNNGWSRFFPYVKNVLSSARHAFVPTDLNYVEYRQEFDLNVFKPLGEGDYYSAIDRHVNSFVNCLPNHELFARLAHKTCPPLTSWKAFGHGSPDGVITGVGAIARIMRFSRFGYHYKPGGDGYGHVLHNWFACGIPIIGDEQQYQGQLAEDLLDASTCIPTSAESILSICNRMDKYTLLRDKVQKRFKAVVNFDYEFDTKLKLFFERLL